MRSESAAALMSGTGRPFAANSLQLADTLADKGIPVMLNSECRRIYGNKKAVETQGLEQLIETDNIHLGNNSFINMHCTLLDTAPITIGECTMIGPDVKIYTAVHALDGSERFWQAPDGIAAVKTQARPVHIGDYVWIGGGSIILPGVTIGNNVVIGAGSVVTESIPDNAIACGNPCKILKWNMSAD